LIQHYQFFDQLWGQIHKVVNQGKQRIAEYMSKYPDTSDLILTSSPSRSALEAIVDIWALEYLLPGVLTRHQTYDQRERYARLVRSHHREGLWKVVEQLIQQPQGFYYLETVLLEHFSTEDLFGNLVPLLKKRLTSMTPNSKIALQQRSLRKPVKKKVRRRGYSDHGTLRPSHQWLPYNAYAEPEREEEPEVEFRAPRPHQWVDDKLSSRPDEDRYSSQRSSIFLRK